MSETLSLAQTQITFKTNLSLKERTLQKVRQDGITLKALLTMAMREYLNNNLVVSLRLKEDYYDEVFADKDVVKKANEMGRVLKKDKVFGENLALNNKAGKNLIIKMMDLALGDMKYGRYKKLSD